MTKLRQHAPWTRMEILRVAEQWQRRHGRQPVPRDWAKKTATTPTVWSVQKMFGSWNRFLNAAGFHQSRPRWNRYRIAVALDKWMEQYGRQPIADDFEKPLSGEYPSGVTIKRHFGSVVEARKYALELRRRRRAAA